MSDLRSRIEELEETYRAQGRYDTSHLGRPYAQPWFLAAADLREALDATEAPSQDGAISLLQPAATDSARPSLWARFLDRLLGPQCWRRCGERVFPRDQVAHEAREHAGDRP